MITKSHSFNIFNVLNPGSGFELAATFNLVLQEN